MIPILRVTSACSRDIIAQVFICNHIMVNKKIRFSSVVAFGTCFTLTFTAQAAFTSVENFESYASSPALTAAWPATAGAPVVTLETASACEGTQAMAFAYSGASAPFTNFVTRTFAANQNWSANTVFQFTYGGTGNSNDDLVIQFLDQNGNVLKSQQIAGGTTHSPCSVATVDISGAAGFQAVRGVRIGVVASAADHIGTVYFDQFQVGNRGVLSILGSSLALGVGSSGYDHNQYVSGGSLSNGYAALLMQTQATNGWRVVNQSIGGDTTSRVINRFYQDEVPVHADEVQIGLSLGNEGLPGASDPQGISDQFFTGITNLIAMSRSNNILPLIGNQYPRNAYTPTEYRYLKAMDLRLNTLDVPSANFLGATDDGSGHWVNNSFINLLGTSDGIHPNDAGFYEMFLTIVPSVFDAVKMGKPTPQWRSKAHFLRITGDAAQSAPLSFNPSLTVHSFTVSFRVRSVTTGTVASITLPSSSVHPTVEITADGLAYVGLNGVVNQSGIAGTNGAWHEVAVAHSWARGLTWFYVDGALASTISERLTPVGFVLGGRGEASTRPASPEQADYQNWFVHRSMMNAEEVNAQFQGRFQQASLELYAPLNDSAFEIGGVATNQAQSLSIAAINGATANLVSEESLIPPDSLIVTSNYTPAMVLNWNDPAAAMEDAYYVERSTAGGLWTNIATLPAHAMTYTDESIGMGTNYQYRVSYSQSGWRSDYAMSPITILPSTNLPTLLIDFGPNNVLDGEITASPDVNGNYWNNLVSTGNGSAVSDLVTIDNQPTTIGLRLTSGAWAANGIRNGGLLNPNPALLGIFAIPTATEDYFYVNQTFGSANAKQTMLISGLDPTLAYNLSMFGTRDVTATRTTIYSVTDGAGVHSTNLVTSGTASNSGTNPNDTAGNDKTIVSLNGLVPNSSGEMTFTLQIGDAANFAYLCALKITATLLPPVFTVQPQSQTFRVGTTSTLTAFASSSDPVQYQWYFGNAPVPDATNATLTLSNILYANAGEYHVTATNTLGEATSAVAVLNIVPPQIQSQAVLIDFGPNDGANGLITSSPDAQGNYWNNLTSGSSVPSGLSLANLVSADNTPTSIGATITSGGWSNNGIQNGGLTAPDALLLGDFAVATATEDYFFVQGGDGTTGTLRLNGLNAGSTYNLSFFATRNTTAADIRTSRFSATDANGLHVIDLQTSGAGAGSSARPYGNDDTMVSLTGLKPNVSGQINLTLTIVNGGFAYIGALEISETGNPTASSDLQSPEKISGGWQFQISATPGYAYHAQRATDLSGPWIDIGTVIPSVDGVAEFADTEAPDDQAFYRLVVP